MEIIKKIRERRGVCQRLATVGVMAILLIYPAGCISGSTADEVLAALGISTKNVANNVPNRSITKDLQVQVAFNTTDDIIFWKLSWKGIHGNTKDFFTYSGGTWSEKGGDVRGVLPGDGNIVSSESRVLMAFNDPNSAAAVPNFGLMGCFLACHDDRGNMPGWVAAGRGDEPGMGLPATDATYASGLLDLWHWRGHRSNPQGYSDDQYIDNGQVASPGNDGGGRNNDSGGGLWSTGGTTSGNPDYVQDPATTSTGQYAFKLNKLFTTPDYYFTQGLGGGLINEMTWAAATGAGYVPSEGDTVPRRRLKIPTGSRADITATIGAQVSAWDAGTGRWNVYLQRAMAPGNPGEDVDFVDGQLYEVAFGLHTDNTGSRDHYVSLPYSIGLNTFPADISAIEITGGGVVPDFSDTATYPVHIIEMFLPGIASYEFLTASQSADVAFGIEHEGADVLAGSIGGTVTSGCRNCHVVKASDPNAASAEGGALETRVARRGGIFEATPISLRRNVLPTLQSRCFSCHSNTGTAKASSFGNTAVNADTVFQVVRGEDSNFLNYSSPGNSRMLDYPANNTDGNHPAAGTLVGFDGSQDYNRILYWINYNAPNN